MMTNLKTPLRHVLPVLIAAVLIGWAAVPALAADPLGSWRDGPNKRLIIAFVEKVTTPGSPSFVAPEDRVATFDMDGTVLLEKPAYSLFSFAIPLIKAAQAVRLSPLAMEASMEDGRVECGIAFNEVAVTRHSGQSAHPCRRRRASGQVRGRGLIVSTAAGSTAYNLSAHGPIIPLGSNLLALTPVSPFRPRRWKGALLPHAATVTLENLDPGKRPLAATADFMEVFGVISMAISEDSTTGATLLFDPDRSLEERVIAEQFAM